MGNTEMTFGQKTRLFLSPFWQDRKIYNIALFTYSLSAFNAVIYILFFERVIFFLEQGDERGFYNLLILFVIYYFLYLIAKVFLRKHGRTAHATTARKFIQRKYIPAFVRLDNNTIERLGTGKVIAIVDKGITIWGNLFHHFFEEGIRVSVSIIFTAYMVGKNSNTLLGVFVLLYILVYVSSYYYNLGALKYRRKRRDWGNIHTKHLVKIIMSKNEILFTDKVNNEVSQLDDYYDKETYYNKRMANFLMPMFETPRIIITSLLIFVFYYFGRQYFSGDLQISELVGLSTAFIVMLNTINRGVEFFKNFTKDFSDVEKLWDFFNTTPEIEGYDTGKDFKYKTGEISLKDVSYGYDDGKPVFSNFSLDILGNKITAFVGPSGGGKSTLVKLISGYIRQNSGDVFIDNQNLSEVSLKSYYADVGYLTQEPSVFDGTIIENLLYAVKKEPSKKHVREIIKLAHCEFIYDLPDGLETEIGERGIKLSGGQKQRLAIAKIFLKDPKIIILDEPTSALDSLSEQKITEAMHNLFKGRTVLIIAHRLQTVKHADDIIVIENSQIIERGTHNYLVRKKGYYKQMLDLQSGF